MRADNEILGEYVRKTRPEIAQSPGFLAFYIVERASDSVRWLVNTLKKPEIKEVLEIMKDKEDENE